MDHETLVDSLALELRSGFEFTNDQADVMHAYHEGSGRVCVGSGAGTGKTTTLTRVVAEAVVRMVGPDAVQIESNPFDQILVTTFTRDAAGQLKRKIKQLLREHEANGGATFDPALWRWLETANNISTIDSFVGDLLREIATEVEVAPGFEVRDELETQNLLREVIRELEADEELADALALIESELDDTVPREFLYEIHQKLREFCYDFPSPDADTGTTMFADGIAEQIHQGREPPFEAADIRAIVSSLTGLGQRDVTVPDEETRHRIAEDYRHSLAFATAVDDLIDAFNATYDARSRQEGALSYQDITYIVWEYLDDEASTEFATSLGQRFSHVFVDEFQDTSFAQCQILSHLVADEPRTDLLVIGDVKQSIYSWRSADPEIFAHILDHAAEGRTGPDDYLGAADWTRCELVTNFRSHPQLVRAGNHLFNRVFTSEGMGAIGTFPVEFKPLVPHREHANPDASHLHVLPLGDATSPEWRTRDPQRVAEAVHAMVADDNVTVGSGDDERPVRAGDVTLLFRRTKHMREFRDALDEHGLQNAVVAARGLFKRDEIGFLVDVLDWFANPHSKDSLLRILRSPVTALSDRTLRYLASCDLNLSVALEEWPTGDLAESDRTRLEGLVDLRSDLRWDREGSKAALVQRIIQHTAIETVLLSGEDAIQRYGNLWMLVELVQDWEDEELLPYREFVSQLRRYQQLAQAGDETFEVAQVADSSADDTVKLRTAHSSKGLEFEVVVLPDLLARPGGRIQGSTTLSYRDPETGDRRYALRPRPADDPVAFPDGPGKVWIKDDYRSTLWVAPDRDDLGRFQYQHPYNPAVQDATAEFWRLLYVAFTRAGNHLILSLGDSIHHSHKWSTWAHALLGAFQDGDGWNVSEDSSSVPFQLDTNAMHETDSGPTQIPLGVGLPLAEPVTSTPLGLPVAASDSQRGDEGDSQPQEGADSSDDATPGRSTNTADRIGTRHSEGVPFAPRELSPSTLHDLLACPRRYQFRALQEVSQARGESPPGSNTPDGYSPSYWGTIVHEGLEALHSDVRDGAVGAAENELDTILDRYADISSELEQTIRSYRRSDLWSRVSAADTVLPEYELASIHPSEPQIHISGVVDLLFQGNDGWEVVDFKTGLEPNSDTYLAGQYRSQLLTYIWLLKQEYEVEITTTSVYYVQTGNVTEYDLDASTFGEYLSDLPDRLSVETETGLPANPDPDPADVAPSELAVESRCGSCPYTGICTAWEE